VTCNTRQHRAAKILVLASCAFLTLAMVFATGCSNQEKAASTETSTGSSASAVSDVNDKANSQTSAGKSGNAGSSQATSGSTNSKEASGEGYYIDENGEVWGTSNKWWENQNRNSGSGSGQTIEGESGNTSGQGSAGGNSGNADSASQPRVHEHNWYYYTELTYIGTDYVCNQCGAHVDNPGTHDCTGQGTCSFHTEDMYDRHPVRDCWVCGAFEYL